MVVNFEFLGNEPIENVVTCLNYAVDKVIYFGYSEAIAEQQDNVQKFLKKYCGVTDVLFYPLPHYDLEAILTTMRQEIEYELKQGSDIYFDITGGESLILVAFGMFSKEYDTLMHIYDIPTGKLIELERTDDYGNERKYCKAILDEKNLNSCRKEGFSLQNIDIPPESFSVKPISVEEREGIKIYTLEFPM